MQETLARSFELMMTPAVFIDSFVTKVLGEFIISNDFGTIIEYQGEPPEWRVAPITPFHVGGCI